MTKTHYSRHLFRPRILSSTSSSSSSSSTLVPFSFPPSTSTELSESSGLSSTQEEPIPIFTDEQLYNDISMDNLEISPELIQNSKNGDGAALYNIGKAYYSVGDYGKAMVWFQRSAFKNNSDAQFRIGYMYDIGEGVTTNYKVAMKWYTLAADNGDSTAKNNIGCLYDNGLGVPIDYKLAMTWYLKSAELNNPNALWNIGVLHEYGLGVPRDQKQALGWYHRGANQGSQKSKERIELLNSKGLFMNAEQLALINIDKRTWEMRQDFQEVIDELEEKNQGLTKDVESIKLINDDLNYKLLLLQREKQEQFFQLSEKLEKMENRLNSMEREIKIQNLENQIKSLELKSQRQQKKSGEEKKLSRKKKFKDKVKVDL